MAPAKKTSKTIKKTTKQVARKPAAKKASKTQKKLSDSVNYMSNNGKSMVIYLMLAWFFGAFGAHKFYVGKTGQGVAMLLMVLIGWVLVIPVFIVVIWVLVDLIVGIINFTNPDKILSGK